MVPWQLAQLSSNTVFPRSIWAGVYQRPSTAPSLQPLSNATKRTPSEDFVLNIVFLFLDFLGHNESLHHHQLHLIHPLFHNIEFQ